jgi:hypothetical protein
MKSKAMGRLGDLILRKGKAEYGCAKAVAEDEGQWGTKILLEKGIKVAKILKDMFGQLCQFIDYDESTTRQLRTIGYVISGMLVMAFCVKKRFSHN